MLCTMCGKPGFLINYQRDPEATSSHRTEIELRDFVISGGIDSFKHLDAAHTIVRILKLL
jgi:hypothetical protein